MEYHNWKPINCERANKAIQNGAKVVKLPIPFGSCMASFRHALVTKRGACYVVSDLIMKMLGDVQVGEFKEVYS